MTFLLQFALFWLGVLGVYALVVLVRGRWMRG